jgi:hypothetical protein
MDDGVRRVGEKVRRRGGSLSCLEEVAKRVK